MDHEELIQQIKGVRKIVINRCYGGFGLSEPAWNAYVKLAGITDSDASYYDVARDDPYLVKVVEEMGEEADGDFANLLVVEIPADVNWEIDEYDGIEHIAEVHRTWP